MCGRFTERAGRKKLARRFGVEEHILPPLEARYNIAPGSPVLCLLQDRNRSRFEWLEWGIHFKPVPAAKAVINLRSETAAERRSVRPLLRYSRCVVPADGFFEWTGRAGFRQPWFFQLRSEEIFTFAAVHAHRTWRDGSEYHCVALLTTCANRLVGRVHSRMPVILTRETEPGWLDPERHRPEELQRYLKPFAADKMEGWPVSLAVNSPGREGAACIERAASSQKPGGNFFSLELFGSSGENKS